MATLYCLTNDELKEYLALEKDFQAKIVYSFLTKGVTDFSLMTSLPKATRERISKEHPSALSSKVIRRSSSDSALKLAVELEDGAIVECVRLSDGRAGILPVSPARWGVPWAASSAVQAPWGW